MSGKAGVALRLTAAQEEVARIQREREIYVIGEIAKDRKQVAIARELGVSPAAVSKIYREGRARLAGAV